MEGMIREDRVGEKSAEPLAGLLLPCTICNRTFLPDVLARHQRICEKTALKQRKTFDSVKQRLQGIGIDQIEIKHIRENVLKQPQQHSALQSQYSTSGRKRGGNDDYVHCPHCSRNFCFKAADRHIEWCREQSSRRHPNNVSEKLRDRLAARNKYQPPLPRSRKSRSPAVDRTPGTPTAVGTGSPLQPGDSLGQKVLTCPPSRRVTRDYAKEYRSRVSQEREARIGTLRNSPGQLSANPREGSVQSVGSSARSAASRRSFRVSSGRRAPVSDVSASSPPSSVRKSRSSAALASSGGDQWSADTDRADQAFISSSQLRELRRLTDAVTRSLSGRDSDWRCEDREPPLSDISPADVKDASVDNSLSPWCNDVNYTSEHSVDGRQSGEEREVRECNVGFSRTDHSLGVSPESSGPDEEEISARRHTPSGDSSSSHDQLPEESGRRKARSCELSVLQMLGGGAGVGVQARYCHQCGCAYPVSTARFCCSCGTQRVASVVSRAVSRD